MHRWAIMKNKGTLAKWFKWGSVVFATIVTLLLIYGCILYKSIQNDKTKGFDESRKIIFSETDITDADEMFAFYGEEAFHILFGKTNTNEEKIAFFPLDHDGGITVIDQTKIISKEAIEQTWKKRCSNCHLINIAPAMIDDQPLWEMTYKDDRAKYVIDYLSMDDGSRYERYSFKQRFN